MTTEAAANPPQGGSDSVQPSDALDNPATLDFYEPEEDQDNSKTEQSAGTETDRETGEATEGQETEGEPQEAVEQQDEQAAEGENSPKEPADSVLVAMPDGQKLELKELKSGYMRDRDYRHKTTEVANKRRDLEASSARVTGTVNAIAKLLMDQVPPAPDHSLSLSDPLRYVQEQAAHNSGRAVLDQLFQKAGELSNERNALTQEQQAEHARSEIAKLEQAFPQTRTQDGKVKFIERAVSAAREMGFTDDELNAVTDHRHFAVLHYAQLGLQAEKAQKVAARKTANVPPVAPQKQRQQGAVGAMKARANQEAMKRLTDSGSMTDAMSVDFE